MVNLIKTMSEGDFSRTCALPRKSKKNPTPKCRIKKEKATPRIELGNESFADFCLTAWLCRRPQVELYYIAHPLSSIFQKFLKFILHRSTAARELRRFPWIFRPARELPAQISPRRAAVLSRRRTQTSWRGRKCGISRQENVPTTLCGLRLSQRDAALR